MLFFLDTEFTDFETMGLISIGLVSANGQQRFYFELTDYDPEACSTFVRKEVLPLLGAPLVPSGTSKEMAGAVTTWLAESVGFQGTRPGETPILASDFQGDARLLHARLDTFSLHEQGIPTPRFLNCDGLTEGLTSSTLFQGLPLLQRHHALDDAEALRRSHLNWVGAPESPMDAPMETWDMSLVRQAPWFTFDGLAINRVKRWERWRR